MTKLYTPDMAGSGQFATCAHCGKDPTPEGHDGCLGTLPHPVMNACCGHGDERMAYIQFFGSSGIGEPDEWGNNRIAGKDAIKEQQRLRYQEQADKAWPNLHVKVAVD